MWDNLQLLFVWAPIINVQVILDGIFVGAVFALSAYGLALVWGVMNIKNLAQGDFVIMGGYLAFALHAYHVPLVLILLIVMPVMFVFGWFIYVIMIRRIIDQDMFVSLLATFGLFAATLRGDATRIGPDFNTSCGAARFRPVSTLGEAVTPRRGDIGIRNAPFGAPSLDES